MKLLVTGRQGQIATALQRAAGNGVVVVALGRPDLDLADPGGAADAIRKADADVIVSAAAYTAVDQAETEPDAARAVNALAPGAMAAAAAARGLPFIHLSTDYVFPGDKPEPYVETDATGPGSVYGATKLEGERLVAAANPDHAILRTAWVYAPYGRNFLRTMLRLAEARNSVSVVDDQHGNPSYAPDIAAGIISVARNLLSRPGDAALRGTFHMSATGDASWAEFAAAIFALSAAAGGPSATVTPIPTSAYPTPARRPANSRLDCARIAAVHGVRLPHWRDATARCIDALQRAATAAEGARS